MLVLSLSSLPCNAVQTGKIEFSNRAVVKRNRYLKGVFKALSVDNPLFFGDN